MVEPKECSAVELIRSEASAKWRADKGGCGGSRSAVWTQLVQHDYIGCNVSVIDSVFGKPDTQYSVGNRIFYHYCLPCSHCPDYDRGGRWLEFTIQDGVVILVGTAIE